MNRIQTLIALTAGLATAAPLGVVAHEHDHRHHEGHAAYDYSKARETPFGKAADPAKATKVLKVSMGDTMRYTPDRITVKRGDTVRFVVANEGKLEHELVLGTAKELESHAQMMKMHPGMEHDAPNMLHVAPGKTGEMGWRFTKAGEFRFGCFEPGHFEAGMKGVVVVTDK